MSQPCALPKAVDLGKAHLKDGISRKDLDRVSYCRDCDWYVDVDKLREREDIRNPWRQISSQGEGHAYFNRGHSVPSRWVYLPSDLEDNNE